MDEPRARFRTNIQMLCARYGISLRQAAGLADISYQAARFWMAEEKDPTLGSIARVAQVFRLDMADVLLPTAELEAKVEAKLAAEQAAEVGPSVPFSRRLRVVSKSSPAVDETTDSDRSTSPVSTASTPTSRRSTAKKTSARVGSDKRTYALHLVLPARTGTDG